MTHGMSRERISFRSAASTLVALVGTADTAIAAGLPFAAHFATGHYGELL